MNQIGCLSGLLAACQGALHLVEEEMQNWLARLLNNSADHQLPDSEAERWLKVIPLLTGRVHAMLNIWKLLLAALFAVCVAVPLIVALVVHLR